MTTSHNVTAFTPGPWLTNCSHIYAPDGAIIATVSNPGSKATDYPLVPNRDLMAAAPELYEALAGMVEASNTIARQFQIDPARDDQHGSAYSKSIAALAKARGEK